MLLETPPPGPLPQGEGKDFLPPAPYSEPHSQRANGSDAWPDVPLNGIVVYRRGRTSTAIALAAAVPLSRSSA
jgi:hypothetical protein